MAFPVLNAAKPLSSVKSRGSELHRLIIHCVKIVSPLISSKCIAFHSNCISSVLVLLGSLYDLLLPVQCYFVPIFSIPCIHLVSILPCLNLPTSPHSESSTGFGFATLSVPPVSFWRQSCHSQTQKWDSPLCVPGFNPTESSTAALWWHSDRERTGHYQAFVLCMSSFMHPDAVLTLVTHGPDCIGLMDNLWGATPGKERCASYQHGLLCTSHICH